MNLVRAFFPKIRALFFKFWKRAGRPPRPPPSSYAPDSIWNFWPKDSNYKKVIVLVNCGTGCKFQYYIKKKTRKILTSKLKDFRLHFILTFHQCFNDGLWSTKKFRSTLSSFPLGSFLVKMKSIYSNLIYRLNLF